MIAAHFEIAHASLSRLNISLGGATYGRARYEQPRYSHCLALSPVAPRYREERDVPDHHRQAGQTQLFLVA